MGRKRFTLLPVAVLAALWGHGCGADGLQEPCVGPCPEGTACSNAAGTCEAVPASTGVPRDRGRSLSPALLPDGTLLVASYSEDHQGVVLETYSPGSPVPREVVLVAGGRTGPVGRFLDLAVGAADGSRYLAFTDEAAGTLRLARWNPSDGSWTQEVVDRGPGRGQWVSLALAADGTPHLAYHDAAAGTLRYARREPGGAFEVEVVDGPGPGRPDRRPVGLHAALLLVRDRPFIAYHDASQGDLDVAVPKEGGGWRVSVLDGSDPVTGTDTGDVGRWVSAAVDPAGNVALAYHDATRGVLRFGRSDRGVLSIETVDSGAAVDGTPESGEPADVGQFASLAFDAEGRPQIAYLDATHLDLRFARRNREGTWSRQVLATEGAVGLWASVVAEPAPVPPTDLDAVAGAGSTRSGGGVRVVHCRLVVLADGRRAGTVEVVTP